MAGRSLSRNARKADTLRTSVSLPADLHSKLEQIAKQKKVSLAWVIRDATEKYVEGKWPLLAKKD